MTFACGSNAPGNTGYDKCTDNINKLFSHILPEIQQKKSSGFLFLMEETSCPVVDDWSVILRWGVASAFSGPQTSFPLLCLKPCALRFPEAVEVHSSALQNKEGDYRSRNLGLGDSLRIPLRSADLGILSTCHDSVFAVVAVHRGLGGDLPK